MKIRVKVLWKMNRFEKSKSKEVWSKLLGILFFVLLLYLAWNYLFSDTDEKYDSFCVDICVSDLDFCTSLSTTIYDKNHNEYLTKSAYDDCFSNLESCVSYCEP